MQSAQSRILSIIEAAVTTKGYEVAQSAAYANTGAIRIYKPASHIEFANIGYDFQDGTYTLRLTVQGSKIPSQPGRPDYFDFYQSYGDESRFWSTLESRLPNLPKASPELVAIDAAHAKRERRSHSSERR